MPRLTNQQVLEGIHNQLIALNRVVGEVQAVFNDIKEILEIVKDSGVRQFQNFEIFSKWLRNQKFLVF